MPENEELMDETAGDNEKPKKDKRKEKKKLKH